MDTLLAEQLRRPTEMYEMGEISREPALGDDHTRPWASSIIDAGTLQDPLAIPQAHAERAPFQLVVFHRHGAPQHELIDVVVRGMWPGPAPVLDVVHGESVIELVVMAVDDGEAPRPYSVGLTLDDTDGRRIEVRGLRHSEGIGPLDLQADCDGCRTLVCGADPQLADLEPPFMHRRGDIMVRVSSPTRQGRPRRSSVTLVA